MKINSKNKGNTFERQVARHLSLWYSNGVSEVVFERRTAGSGGAPRDLSGASGITGDIFAVKQAGVEFLQDLNIECKFYKDLKGDLWRWIAGEHSQIDEFIAQAQVPHKEHWMLILKSNNYPTLTITNRRFGDNTSQVNGAYIFPFKYFLNY